MEKRECKVTINNFYTILPFNGLENSTSKLMKNDQGLGIEFDVLGGGGRSDKQIENGYAL